VRIVSDKFAVSSFHVASRSRIACQIATSLLGRAAHVRGGGAGTGPNDPSASTVTVGVEDTLAAVGRLMGATRPPS